MGNHVKREVKSLMQEVAKPPETLLEIYQGSNPLLLDLARQYFGEEAGVCEGVCVVWIKYSVLAQEETFINDFNTVMLNEAIDFQIQISRTKEMAKSLFRQHTNTMRNLRAIIAETKGKLQELMDRYQLLNEKELPTEAESQEKLSIEAEIRAFAETAEKIKTVGVELDEARELTTVNVRKALAAFHGHDVIFRGNGSNNDLTSALPDLLNGAKVRNCHVYINMNQGNGKPGHIIAFYASNQSVMFIDPNSCLFRFENILSCQNFFTSYWTRLYSEEFGNGRYYYEMIKLAPFDA